MMSLEFVITSRMNFFFPPQFLLVVVLLVAGTSIDIENKFDKCLCTWVNICHIVVFMTPVQSFPNVN